MAYGRRYRKKGRRSYRKTFRRSSKRRGYRKRDYTPTIKLEWYGSVNTSGSTTSSDLRFSDGTNSYTNRLPYNFCFDTNGTWGKYKDLYTMYKITGASTEFSMTRHPSDLDAIWNPSPVIGIAHFPTEIAATFGANATTIKQMDHYQTIVPNSTGLKRFYQRFPNNYISNRPSYVGIGTWNNNADYNSQVGMVAVLTLNGAMPQTGSISTFGYIKLTLYVKFGGKRV